MYNNGAPHGVEKAQLSPVSPQRAATSSIGAGGGGGGGVVALPLPVLVEEQKKRIHALVHERDSHADELRELRGLFHRLRDDYDQATQELEARQLQLDSMQTQKSVAQEALLQAQAREGRQTQDIQQFEVEWAERTRHLRAQLDALTQERDAMQSQRDVCMSENSDLRRQLIQLQGELYEADVRHREELREQASGHAQQLRAALQEKEEQLQTRAAATRHEARLTQQQLAQLEVNQTSAREDREALRWRLAELETALDKKEHLRSELERMVGALRAQASDQEQQARGDAQRYAQRAQELERTYEAQLSQEQHRCQTLQDELAAARRALQEAQRQHEVQAATHAAHTRDITARYAAQEDELREQLRSTRAELTETGALAARHEAAVHRSQREAEALRTAAAAQQEERTQLQEAQVLQTQQRMRAEGRVEILKARLQEKEREAELLRCTMEQTAWTSEMRDAMQHTLAAVFGVPRALAVKWLQKKGVPFAESATPQLEWQAAQQQPKQQQQDATNDSPTRQSEDKSHVKTPSPQQGASASTDTHTHHHHEAPVAEAEALRSPVRSTSASTQAAATQHVESIERTVARSAASPISVVQSSHAYAAPPLHPGTVARTTAMMTPSAAGAAAASHNASPAPSRHASTPAANGVASPSTSFVFSPRSPLLASAQAAVATAGAALFRTPAQQRHQYNIGESDDDDEGQGVAEDDDGGGRLAGDSAHASPRGGERDTEKKRAKVEEEEVFFDAFSTPAARRNAAPRRTMSVPMAVQPEQEAVRTASVGPRAASTQPVFLNSFPLSSTPRHGTPLRQRADKPQTAAGVRNGPSRLASVASVAAAARTPSTPGARAAELLAQLPPYSPAASAGASLTSTPFSSASAMAAARQRHVDHLSEDEDGLQQYLKETVQQVLARQRGDLLPQRHPAEPLPSSSSAPQPGLRGHSHYTQLYDGLPLRGVPGGDAEGEVEGDFGSVSRPRSVLSVLPWQQRTALTPQAADTAAHNNEGDGQGRQVDRGAPTREQVHALPKTSVPAPAAASVNAKTGAPVKASHRGQTTQLQDRAARRVEAGVADALEQLARRQQQLLQSLGGATEGAALLRTIPTLPVLSNAAAATYPGEGAPLGQPSGPARLATTTTAIAAAAEEGAEFLRSSILQDTKLNGAHDAQQQQQQLSDIASSDAVLDPRQLSYATASTSFAAPASEGGAHAHERHGRSDPLAAPWQAPSARLHQQGGTMRAVADPSPDIQGGSTQLEYRSGEARSGTSSTPPSAPSLDVSSSYANVSLLSASSGNKAPLASVSDASGPPGAPSVPASSERLSWVSATQSNDVVAAAGSGGLGPAKKATGGRSASAKEPPMKDAAAAFTGATAAASVLTSVSAASSLTQLERRFARPFTQ
ncbi:hypothetical protein ABB37_08280 [Leptomonas pyrrhocoris]|uniref:Uncharacterized protein n=1 Tax=Leptomonas pyrrhocoris TaxID=157538 RepID=A0A0M9FTG6_LEPPY|nr:hypothetical protein ABB37_08280 [Leptomonas pyrrhocoris]KPA75740.1 hypothetical protein ABB37_08280 [Leptomonas pyrrhocoris]|eukprot:XP_015654179.1 hypothetical protein ABB37_08280 [Leptomonas pyrrhocoris]